MWRISKRQKEGNAFLQEIDNYLFADVVEIKNDKIKLSLENQKMFITENVTRFSDITTMCEDLKKLQDTAVILVDSITKEEVEIYIEIEGGI